MTDIIGTSNQDVLKGGSGDDLILGLGGDDFLYGKDGNDTLKGGEGGDVIWGGDGDDRMVGGGGDDNLVSYGGRDVMLGGAGDDQFDIYRQSVLNDDFIKAEGGAGNDFFYFSSYNAGEHVRLAGGDGDDLFLLWGSKGTLHVDLGDGHDIVYAASRYADGDGPVLISHFTAGDGGDVLDLNGTPLGYPQYTGGLVNWDGVTDPFADGHLQLVQHGKNVDLMVDPDGGGDHYSLSLTFKGASLADFTAENFGGWDPMVT